MVRSSPVHSVVRALGVLLPALVLGLGIPAVAGASAPTTEVQVGAAGRLEVSVAPTRIAPGQPARVQVTAGAREKVRLYAYTLPSRSYRLVRTGTTNTAGAVSWLVRPRADTRLYAASWNGDATRQARSTVLQVRKPGSACSATGMRYTYADSAMCLFTAFVRRDRAMAANYATPAAAAEFMSWRVGTRPVPWVWQGCGEPTILQPSSGVSCGYYDPLPGEVHGVYIELGMSRQFRVEAVDTVG